MPVPHYNSIRLSSSCNSELQQDLTESVHFVCTFRQNCLRDLFWYIIYLRPPFLWSAGDFNFVCTSLTFFPVVYFKINCKNLPEYDNFYSFYWTGRNWNPFLCPTIVSSKNFETLPLLTQPGLENSALCSILLLFSITSFSDLNGCSFSSLFFPGVAEFAFQRYFAFSTIHLRCASQRRKKHKNIY